MDKRTAWINSLSDLSNEELLAKYSKLVTQADPMNTVVDYDTTLDMVEQVRLAILSRMA